MANQLLSTPVVVKEINCNRVSVEDLRSFESELKVKNEKDDVVVMHGFGFWFDVLFEVIFFLIFLLFCYDFILLFG